MLKSRLCFTSKYWSKNAYVYNLSYLVLNPNFSHCKYAKFNPITGISFVFILCGGVFLVIVFFFPTKLNSFYEQVNKNDNIPQEVMINLAKLCN